jgi:hypothetical protein
MWRKYRGEFILHLILANGFIMRSFTFYLFGILIPPKKQVAIVIDVWSSMGLDINLAMLQHCYHEAANSCNISKF